MIQEEGIDGFILIQLVYRKRKRKEYLSEIVIIHIGIS